MKHPHYDIAMWYFSDPENNQVQESTHSDGWADVGIPNFHPSLRYRCKPAETKRIKINGVEINAPLSEAPSQSAECFLMAPRGVTLLNWHDGQWERRALTDGRIFATEQDAQAAYDAITLALTGVNK